MTVKEYIQFTQLAWMIIGMYLLFLTIISIDMQPDKKTRKILKEIAKEKKVRRYVIINTILRIYCEHYEKQKIKEQKNSATIKNTEENEKPIQEKYFGQYERYSDLTDEELRLALKIRKDTKKPTFEEWKAAKEKEMKADSIEAPEEKKIQKVKPKIKH